ncbi:hypothetical protein [Robiginitalea sediminis]|uniref:hypothetical protein n=1 Tax=Robiginitalea sediminis TaxID=1982593 RepID=UPI000B4A5980|nr:hypothetical protein [Robiginitalea sediminis]
MKTTQNESRMRRMRVLRQLSLWTLFWVLTKALVVFGHKSLWSGTPWITAVFLALNLLVGIGMVWTYKHLMTLMDELERKIQLESMGITLGLTLVAGIGYSVMDITNLIPWDAEIGILIFFTGACYIISMIVNTRRYC